MFSLLAENNPIEHVLPHDLWRIYSHDGVNIYLTNFMLMACVSAVLMLLIFPVVFRKADWSPPRGARNLLESILEFLRVEVFRPALKEKTDQFVPFLWTMFFFILFCNLLGAIPINEIISLIMGKPVHYSGTATGTMSTTGALAICAFLCIHLQGILEVFRSLVNGTYGHHAHHDEHSSNGVPPHEAAQDLEHMRGEALAADVPNQFNAIGDPTHHYGDDEHKSHGAEVSANDGHCHGMNPVTAALLAVPLYFWNFAPHPFKPAPGASMAGWLMDVPMWMMLLVLELIGALIKPFALAIRLFANMIAGHIVLAVLAGLIPVTAGLLTQIAIGVPITVLSLLIYILELFVGFLQAYIFTFLTTLFIASAVAPEH